MEAESSTEPAAVLDRLIRDSLPGQRGLVAWRSFLRAHASLMRALATEMATETGLTLGEFEVLLQVGFNGGSLRMTDLAERAFASRSAMTRRVDHLVEEGLVERTVSESDGRATIIALTNPGLERLCGTVPVHMRGIAKMFVDPLDDQELDLLERVMAKVAVNCSFG
jgi:DNA-binding MarR family transcriptional regulator